MNGLATFATIATTFGKPFDILFPSTFRKVMASVASTPQTRMPTGLELATCAGRWRQVVARLVGKTFH